MFQIWFVYGLEIIRRQDEWPIVPRVGEYVFFARDINDPTTEYVVKRVEYHGYTLDAFKVMVYLAIETTGKP